MKIRILFFAAHREIVGTPETDVDAKDGSTVGEVLQTLMERGAPWTNLPESLAVAVNRTYSPSTTVLRDGDELALIPPVAGG